MCWIHMKYMKHIKYFHNVFKCDIPLCVTDTNKELNILLITIMCL
jgi:hypothetical protein